MIILLRNLCLTWALLLTITGTASASETPTIREVLEVDSRSEEILEQIKDEQQPSKEGETPLSSILALHLAAQEHNWDKAAQFIDTRYLPEEMAGSDASDLIRKLSIIWTQNRLIDFSALSTSPDGFQDDGLPSYRDLLGTIPLDSNESIPIYLQRVPDGAGGRIWKISNASTREIPRLWEVYGYNPLLVKLEERLPNFDLLYMQNWQVIGLLLIVLAAAITAYCLRWVLLWSIQYSDRYRDTMHQIGRAHV